MPSKAATKIKLGDPPSKRRLHVVPGKRNSLRMKVPLSKCFIDPEYGAQRPFNSRWVEARKGAYDANAVGTPEVSYRDGTGTYAILDAQHRIALALLHGVAELEMLVHFDLTSQEESELFLLLNDQRPLGKANKFAARFRAGEAKAAAIHAIGQEAGYVIGGSGETGIKQVATIEHVYDDPNLGSSYLRRAFYLARSCWHDQKFKIDGLSVAGIALVLRAGKGTLDEKAFRTMLAGTTPRTLKLKIKERMGGRTLRTDQMPMAIASQMLHDYNYRRTTHRTPEDSLEALRNKFWL